jgi:hypothetical protein
LSPRPTPPAGGWPPHPHQPMTRTERVVVAVLNRVPRALLTHAYELVVSVVLAAVAVPVIFGSIEPTSIHAAVRPWMRLTWSITLLLGATTTVAGLLLNKPRTEWSGQIVMGASLLLYAVAVLDTGASRSGVAGAVFAALGCLGLWRALKIAYRRVIDERLARDLAEALAAEARGRARG